MKRDWDLIREILLKLEENTIKNNLHLSDFDENKSAETSYQAEILLDAGLIKGEMRRTIGSGVTDFFIQSMTWEGHEFLDSIKSDTLWGKTKSKFKKEGVSMTFDIIKQVASTISIQALNLN